MKRLFHDRASSTSVCEEHANIAALELGLFGKARFKPGDTIELGFTFFTHCRADRVEWKGKFTLSE